MRRTRSLHKRPNSVARTTKVYRVGYGTPFAFTTRTLRYRRGTCLGATVANPHDLGACPDTCDRCYIFTDQPTLPLPTRDAGSSAPSAPSVKHTREWYAQRQTRRLLADDPPADRDYFREGIARPGRDPNGD